MEVLFVIGLVAFILGYFTGTAPKSSDEMFVITNGTHFEVL